MVEMFSHSRPKSLAEAGVCFGCVGAILFTAAVATSWLFSLI